MGNTNSPLKFSIIVRFPNGSSIEYMIYLSLLPNIQTVKYGGVFMQRRVLQLHGHKNKLGQIGCHKHQSISSQQRR